MDQKYKELIDKEIEAFKFLGDHYQDKEYKNATCLSAHSRDMQVGNARKAAELLDLLDTVQMCDSEIGEYPIEAYFYYNGIRIFSLHSVEGDD